MNRVVSVPKKVSSVKRISRKKPAAPKMPLTFQKKHLALAIGTILGASCGLVTLPAFAGPEGGVVTGGSGSISNNGNTTTINQTTDRMAIDWNTFNVNSDERVDFR